MAHLTLALDLDPPAVQTYCEGLVSLHASAYAALDAWECAPQSVIVHNADATVYAVGHEQPVAWWYPRWQQTSPEELERLIEDDVIAVHACSRANGEVR
jgi:hypothetical protein